MSDDIGTCRAYNITHARKVRLTRGVEITAEAIAHTAHQLLDVLVNRRIPIVAPVQIVARADDIIKIRNRLAAKIILLDTAEHTDAVGILDLERIDLIAVLHRFFNGHAVVTAKRGIPVTGQTDNGQTPVDGGQNHFLRRKLAVTIFGMHVKIRANHDVIFSCLTLWSMT